VRAIQEGTTSSGKIARALLAALITVLLGTTAAAAAGIGLAIQQVDSSQFPRVRVYVSVADSDGVPITGLDAQAFQLSEDGKPINGLQVQPIIDSQEPIAVALIMDVSGSMNDAGKLAGAKNAASAFVDTMGPNDTAALISFSDSVTISQGYTGNHDALKKAISQLAAKGDTALYDAIIQAAVLQGAVPQQRKVMLLLTDGADTKSKQSLDAAISAAKGAGAPVFAVGLGGDVKKDVLDRLAAATGGQAFYVSGADQLKQVFLSIGDQLRREYALEYSSSLPADGKSHSIAVQVNYRGQTAQGSGTLVARTAPLAVDVTGITTASTVTGPLHIQVTATSGVIARVDLLVDNQVSATAQAAPFILSWDSTTVSPGLHRLVVRASDASGATTEKEFVVQVAGAASPTPTATPPHPTALPATAAPTPVPTTAAISPLSYAVAGGGVLILAAAVAAAVVLGRRPAPAPPTLPPAPPPQPPREQTVITDHTEAMALPSSGESTVVSAGATIAAGATVVPSLPRARLIILQNGVQSEVVIQEAETMIGREASNAVVIRDPMASRRHAKIIVENGEFWIEDLKSLNGTRVNGEAISRRKLAANDQIKIGEVVLTFKPE
jgi:VWFA-related protein